ncbi:MAG TPA: coproporphyrinogen dehydrogenase HemZ [Lachnospiraceae bacterium]|nr:coproporphyrinogen dehydrogenase HemZ [Lachnospiraceae bacterium]
MIHVITDTDGLSYDLNAITKEFYPHEEIRVDFCDGEIPPDAADDIGSSGNEDKEEKVYLILKEDQNERGIFIGGKKHLKDPAGLPFGIDIKSDKHKVVNLYYDILSDINEKKLPWGSLTGVRPTKIARMLMDEGKSDDEIINYYLKERRVSADKAELSVNIASLERKLIEPLSDTKGYSLYIDIPFCPTTCAYCSFTSYPIKAYEKYKEDYLDALFKEMEAVRDMIGEKKKAEPTYRLDTVYIGGGTPTSLEPEDLKRLLTKIEECFEIDGVKEFTVEAGRPDSITKDKLNVIKAHPVTRISINPQTMNDKTLKLIGRNHSVSDFINAFHLARECGFENINTDIILALPEESTEDVINTLRGIEGLSPDSLTVHTLAIKRASRLRMDRLKVNITQSETDENIEKTNNEVDITLQNMMSEASKAAANMNMHPYYLYRQKNMSGNLENTGFAKEGKYGLYNILIMEEIEDIIALGAGGISKRLFFENPGDPKESVRIERCENVKDLKSYIERVDEMIGRKRALFL